MKQLKLKTSWQTAIEDLSDAECGRLFRGMLQYASSGEAPKLGGSERILWAKARAEIDEQRSISEKRADAGRIGGSKPKQTEANGSKPKQTEANGSKEKTPPIPPTPPITPVKENLKKTPPYGGAKESQLSFVLRQAVDEFKAMRNRMRKPMTPLAVDLMLKKLEQLAPGNERQQVEILHQSIENGWTGVYELKRELRKRTSFDNYASANKAHVDLKTIEATLDTDFGGDDRPGLARSRKNNTLLNYKESGKNHPDVKEIQLDLEEL